MNRSSRCPALVWERLGRHPARRVNSGKRKSERGKIPANVLWCGIGARGVNGKWLLKPNVRSIVTASLYSERTTMSTWLIRESLRAAALDFRCFVAMWAGGEFPAVGKANLH